MINQYEKDIKTVSLPNMNTLAGSSVLVTGSTGLIGRCLLKMLHYHNFEHGYIIYAGCRNIDMAKKLIGINETNNFKYVEIDVTKEINLEFKVDYIIDAASSASPQQFYSDPVGVMKSNLFGVCNLFEYGINHGLKKFLYISSGEVYGQGDGRYWRENETGYIDQMAMRSAYPSSKRCAETLCVAYAKQYGVCALIARLCHTYGPEFQLKDNRAYAEFFKNTRERTPIVLKSKGGQIRSWLYVVDCATAIITILIKGNNMNAYNVADRDSIATVSKFAELVAEVSGSQVEYHIESDENASPIKNALFDTGKIESLGWKPNINLYEGIKHSVTSL